MTDVFLSYKAEDRARIAPLVAALEADGLSVWWDAHIGGGDDWRGTIQRHLDASRCVIVAWSKRSVGPHGQFVRDEASRAQRRGVYLPVRIDKVDPPLGFGETQALPLNGWKGDRGDARYQATLAAARSIVGIEPTANSEPTKEPNVSRRMVVAGGAIAATSVAGAGAWWWSRSAGAESDSIAVLPFANLSGDPAQAYFSDGMAEELRNALSRITGLKVVARTSSEAMRDADAKVAADKLDVANILTGSVRRSPAMIRIGAQLVDGRQGVERWSASYDRPAGDALQIQTDIAQKVAEALSIRLGGSDRNRLVQGGTDNPDAHDLLLRAQAYIQQNEGAEALQRATGMVDSALALEPRYGDAIAVKATMLTKQAGMYSSSALESQRVYKLAEQTARRAIQIAPQSRLGYWALADILDQQLHFRAALAQFQKMVTVPGDDGNPLASYAVFLSEIGRSGEALGLIDQAIAVDPLNPWAYGWKATILGNARRYADAIKVVDRMMEIAPGSEWARGYRAYCHMMLGNNELARREFDAMGDGPSRGSPAYLAVLAVRQGDSELVERVLAWMRETSGDAAHYQYAQIFAQQGNKGEAIEALEEAWIARDPGLTGIKVDPLLDPVSREPRFQAILRHLDFP